MVAPESPENEGRPGTAIPLSHNTYCTGLYSTVFRGNLFLHQRSEDVSNVYAISLGFHTFGEYKGTGVHVRNVVIENNIAHGLKSNGSALVLSDLGTLRNVLIRGNHFQMPGMDTRLVKLEGKDHSGLKFSGNTYYSDAAKDGWFSLDGKPMDIGQWRKASGEPNAQAKQIHYPDDTRNIQNYMKHLGLEPTREAFYAEIRKQCKAYWRPEFTAPVINDWMRAGFGMERTEKKP
mgnify:CR=1 FL=1